MAANPVEIQLEQCLNNFEKEYFHILDLHFMTRTIRVCNHYVGEDKGNVHTLNSFLQCCNEGNWGKAKSLYPGAKDEYEKYIKANGNKNQNDVYARNMDYKLDDRPPISTTDKKEHINRQTLNEVEDLERRSKDASLRLRHNNPNITDLSDPNRPGKLAERFSELYSNEYTDAFEELNRAKYSEQKIIEYLLSIVQSAEDHVRRCAASKKLPDVIKDFIDRYCPSISQRERLQGKTRTYAEQCVEILYFMSIQQPPLHLEFIDTSKGKNNFDPNRYRGYTKSGNFVEFCVWPVLLLHQKGPILMKGIAQGC